MVKTLHKLAIEGNYFNIIKAIYEKPRAKSYKQVKDRKLFLLRSGTRQGRLLFALLFNKILGV